MKDLQTLDVRDTKIEILPKSLWDITTLRHVYVPPGPRIKGPPPTANIPNLEILKTVGVPESWLENVPNLSINLRKLALSYVGHLEFETISNPLSRMVDLLSLTIMGPIVHAELGDTRAFPNLHTLKSIKFVGKWKFWKLSIDNVGFPPNLVKLILSKSHLREDPMPCLGRLHALKLLRLEDGAYVGDKMVCPTNGFPQLEFLQLSKLENLKFWGVDPTAMLQLSKLRVLQCHKFKNLPDLEHADINVVDLVSILDISKEKGTSASLLQALNKLD
ncbi:putative disease resistance protein RF9 [Carex rostrata]